MNLFEVIMYVILGGIAVKLIDPDISQKKMIIGLGLGIVWSVITGIFIYSMFGITISGFNITSFGSLVLLLLSKGIEFKQSKFTRLA